MLYNIHAMANENEYGQCNCEIILMILKSWCISFNSSRLNVLLTYVDILNT